MKRHATIVPNAQRKFIRWNCLGKPATLLCTAGVLVLAARAFAADSDLMDMSLDALAAVKVTVAGAKEETVLSSASTVSVIDRKMIDDYNFPDVATALETVAGVQGWRTYLKQSVPTFRGMLQDNYANKVLVMINNVPTWNAVTGEGEVNRINIHDIERIEVMRGPGSVIYGSQAYVGAVNIVLRETKPGKVQGEAHGGFGNNGAYSGGANFRWATTNGWSAMAGVHRLQGPRRNYTFTDELGRRGHVDDYVDNENVSLRLARGEHSFVFNAFQQQEGYLGVTPRLSDGAGNPHEVQGFLTAYTLNHAWSDKLYSDVTAFFDMNQRTLSRSANDWTNSNVLGYRTGVNLRNRYAVTDKLGVELGGDAEFRKSIEYTTEFERAGLLLNENNMANRHLYEYSLYGQADYHLQPLRFVAGARFTENEVTGNNVSPRATIVWEINKNNALKLIAGESFRSPSLFELYFTAGTVQGNADLKPEINDTIELLYQTQVGPFSGQVGGYLARYDQKIFRSGTTYANSEPFDAQGIEAELKYNNPKWVDVFANIDYVHADEGDAVPDTANPGQEHFNFKYVPDYTVSMGVHRRFGPFDVSLIANHIDSTQGPKEEVDSYVWLDANISYTHQMKRLTFRHSVRGFNLLDEEALQPEYVRRRINEVPIGPGRGVFYSMTVSF